ncbi:carboxymuconolactone decarboxylase family protein [Nocardioides sp. Iso805N]|uniref:carboxymuconolactone decarboxylase family protein n=1 Tax=Nocardioides sp. Iso805N TaxID=1283287 RepID=UPI00037E85D0|nr:carboxymuconolactone decarboxylase family protein [Nocardioides sp. Iso805N]
MPRIELIIAKEQLSPDRFEEYDSIMGVLGRVGGPFGVLLHSPGLAEKVCKAGAQVRLGSELTMAERELALLSTSREKDASYEWATHTSIARDHGVREEAITAIRDGLSTDDLEEDERHIIEFVRELLRTNRVSQARFDALTERHGERWVVELTGTVGQYQYIAAINNVFEIEPKPGGDVLPIPMPSH